VWGLLSGYVPLELLTTPKQSVSGAAAGSFFERGLSAPIAVSWEVTYACNLSCIHCLSSSGKKRPGELTLEECKGLMDELARLKVFYVYIGGGEPFARRDLLDILEYADQRGLRTPISTNGTLINGEIAQRLSTLKNIRVQLSLDGASPATHDRIRGVGSFNRALRALDYLKEFDVPYYITTVLTRFNFPELDQLYRLAQAQQVKLRVQRLRPSGRGVDSWDLLHPTPDQFVQFHRWLLEHEEVLTADSFFFVNALGESLKGFSICGAAKMICLISPTGDVYPCPFIQAHEFVAGNIKEKPFQEIWTNSDVFDTFRNLELHECSGCPANKTCNGGCRATAYFIRKSLEKSDAECMRRAMDENPNLRLMLDPRLRLAKTSVAAPREEAA